MGIFGGHGPPDFRKMSAKLGRTGAIEPVWVTREAEGDG
jgi:hypothetical protein